MKALGDSMVGNVNGPYRIDGWSSRKWFEGENETMSASNSDVFLTLQSATLALNLEDGTFSSDTDHSARLGFICQGESDLRPGIQGCKNETEGSTTNPVKEIESSTFGSVTDSSTYIGADDNMMTTMGTSRTTNPHLHLNPGATSESYSSLNPLMTTRQPGVTADSFSSPAVDDNKCPPSNNYVNITTGVYFLLVKTRMSYRKHHMNCLKMGADGLAQVKTEAERDGLLHYLTHGSE